ncbi:hypothetical protein B0T13DRAFT_460084 [Neurospora crassa]|nr:hypothetical protein B0T13DRAFT_460084 [Neurospora crassa]
MASGVILSATSWYLRVFGKSGVPLMPLDRCGAEMVAGGDRTAIGKGPVFSDNISVSHSSTAWLKKAEMKSGKGYRKAVCGVV